MEAGGELGLGGPIGGFFAGGQGGESGAFFY